MLFVDLIWHNVRLSSIEFTYLIFFPNDCGLGIQRFQVVFHSILNMHISQCEYICFHGSFAESCEASGLPGLMNYVCGPLQKLYTDRKELIKLHDWFHFYIL